MNPDQTAPKKQEQFVLDTYCLHYRLSKNLSCDWHQKEKT